MRLFFFILLLVNALAFAYYHYREQQASPGRPALPALSAERIRLVGAEPANGQGATLTEPLSCWSWSGFKAEELDAARAELDALSLGDKLKQTTKEEYWLHIPPLKNKADAEKKLAELKALTIEDGALLEERGKWRLAISLGVFPTEDAATVRWNQLKEKGLKSAKLIKREAPGDAFSLQAIDAKTADALSKLQARYGETTLTKVDCPSP